MKRLLLLSVLLMPFLLIQGCSGTPPKEDSKVRVVSAESSYLVNCKMLGGIEAEAKSSLLVTSRQHLVKMKNNLKNEAIRAFPLVDTVGMSNFEPDVWAGRPDPMVVGVAFKCFD
mgnify:CR=1 FL=1|jgi:hypothetical protein